MEKEQMKARRHKRIISRRNLTKSEIEQGKNFNALLGDYQKITKPFYKNLRIMRAVILIFVVVLLILLVVVEETNR
jgi:hypothetical protein